MAVTTVFKIFEKKRIFCLLYQSLTDETFSARFDLFVRQAGKTDDGSIYFAIHYDDLRPGEKHAQRVRLHR